MPRRTDPYRVPFEVPELPYGQAVRIAADTGLLPGAAAEGSSAPTGPLLETVVDMLDELARPDEHMDCIQVAGTNGKTSTSRFAAAILAGEGVRSALYTSPQLVRYEERMEVAGRVISPELFAHGVSAAAEAGRRVNARRMSAGEAPYTITPFDLLTAAALVVFAEERVEVAVLEVGLGGRWDATSATDPVAVAITGIGLDHMCILGDTLAKIAVEKAAVIKPGRIAVLGEGVHEPEVEEVMEERCRTCQVEPLYTWHRTSKAPRHLGDTLDFQVPTLRTTYICSMRKPVYQAQNAACAIVLVEEYLGRMLDAERLSASLDAAPTPGRFDVMRAEPLVLADACHNPQSCETFVSALDEIDARVDGRPTLLIAALADKDVAGIVRVLVPAFPRVAVCATASERALPPEELAQIVTDELAREGRAASDLVSVHGSVAEALAALEQAGEPLVAAGTITLAGEVAACLRG